MSQKYQVKKNKVFLCSLIIVQWLIFTTSLSWSTWLDLTKDLGPMSNCDCGIGAMWLLWPLKSGLVRWRPIVGEYLSWITPGPVPIPLPDEQRTRSDVGSESTQNHKWTRSGISKTCTWHLSKHVSQSPESLPVQLHSVGHEGAFQEEVHPHPLRHRCWDENTQILTNRTSDLVFPQSLVLKF